MLKTCVCGRKKPFNQCCGRFLAAGKLPKTPEQLMRSRYSAYALGGYGDYLLDTWFSASRGKLSTEFLSEKTVDWVQLNVLSSKQTGDKATVEFNAFYREPSHTECQTMHEISVFQRTAGRWFYVGKEASNEPTL